jgi:hypothetical protein
MVILLAVVMARGRQIVGRLIRSRQLARRFGLPVYVVRLPPAPLCEIPIHAVTTSGRDRPRRRLGDFKSLDLFFDFVCECRGAGPVYDPMIERERERNDFCALIFAFVGN